MQCCAAYQNRNVMKQSSLPLTVKYPDTNYSYSLSCFSLMIWLLLMIPSNSSFPIQTRKQLEPKQALNMEIFTPSVNISYCKGYFWMTQNNFPCHFKPFILRISVSPKYRDGFFYSAWIVHVI